MSMLITVIYLLAAMATLINTDVGDTIGDDNIDKSY
jgi:hypothetical protein